MTGGNSATESTLTPRRIESSTLPSYKTNPQSLPTGAFLLLLTVGQSVSTVILWPVTGWTRWSLPELIPARGLQYNSFGPRTVQAKPSILCLRDSVGTLS